MATENPVGDASHEMDMTPLESQLPEMEALAIQGILEAGGIPFTTFGNATLPVDDFSINVPTGRLEEARALLAAAKAAGPAAAEEAELAGESSSMAE